MNFHGAEVPIHPPHRIIAHFLICFGMFPAVEFRRCNRRRRGRGGRHPRGRRRQRALGRRRQRTTATDAAGAGVCGRRRQRLWPAPATRTDAFPPWTWPWPPPAVPEAGRGRSWRRGRAGGRGRRRRRGRARCPRGVAPVAPEASSCLRRLRGRAHFRQGRFVCLM